VRRLLLSSLPVPSIAPSTSQISASAAVHNVALSCAAQDADCAAQSHVQSASLDLQSAMEVVQRFFISVFSR
jgi:hypothetical protein